MKKYFLLIVAVMTGSWVFSQNGKSGNLPEFQVKQAEVEAQLRFLADDMLKGRRTGSVGNDMAATFIAAHLESYGYQSVEGAKEYFQPIPFVATKPPVSSTMQVNKEDFTFGEDYIIMGGEAADIKATAVFADHGWVDEAEGIDDYADLDVAGKVVFTLSGYPGAGSPTEVLNSMSKKRELAKARGAVALVEIYRLNFPWDFFKRYFGGESLRVAEGGEEGNDMVYAWMKNITGDDLYQDLKNGKKVKVKLSSSGFRTQKVSSNNVLGVLEGSDPQLRNEYILLTAHYDHVGVGEQGSNAYTQEDSIFNGARDNAMGTVALLTAAKTLALERPKRSVIVMAVTGEELGLLGSAYYADNPLIPLEKTIFNLNTDGAGYNDTDYLSVIGFGRTGIDDHIEAAAAAAGLEVKADPAPEQNLFDRSDNVSFAQKGIPALTISPGFTSFDAEIRKYYHQVADEADAVDMGYLLKYCQAYAHLARLVANDEERPVWKEGDKYEEAGKELYKMDE